MIDSGPPPRVRRSSADGQYRSDLQAEIGEPA